MSRLKKTLLFFTIIFLIGILIPQWFSMPVEGATSSDYNQESFWYYPWGKSVTHKGIDIFANKGTRLNAATSGLVLYSGKIEMGGNVVVVLSAKWRIHYYAHLDEITTSSFSWASKGKQIGTVGDSGNAAGKPPHLHYSIVTPIPYPWRIDNDRQGWKKMFYLNPLDYLQ